MNTARPITRALIDELKALSRTPEHRAHELHATHCHLSAQAWGDLSRASEAVARALRCDAPHSELQTLRAARDAADANVTALQAEIEADRARMVTERIATSRFVTAAEATARGI